MRLVWRKEPSEGGLRSIGQSERGKELRCAGETVGHVKRHIYNGDYYWYGHWGEMAHNSLWEDKTYHHLEDAMAALKAYITKRQEETPCK